MCKKCRSKSSWSQLVQGSDKKFCNPILNAFSQAPFSLEWQGLFKKIPAWYYLLHKISKNYFMQSILANCSMFNCNFYVVMGDDFSNLRAYFYIYNMHMELPFNYMALKIPKFVSKCEKISFLGCIQRSPKDCEQLLGPLGPRPSPRPLPTLAQGRGSGIEASNPSETSKYSPKS